MKMILRKKCSNCDLYDKCVPNTIPGMSCKRMQRGDQWRPKKDPRVPCPKCGSKRVTLCIIAYEGTHHCECRKCGHTFLPPHGPEITLRYKGQKLTTVNNPEIDEYEDSKRT